MPTPLLASFLEVPLARVATVRPLALQSRFLVDLARQKCDPKAMLLNPEYPASTDSLPAHHVEIAQLKPDLAGPHAGLLHEANDGVIASIHQRIPLARLD